VDKSVHEKTRQRSEMVKVSVKAFGQKLQLKVPKDTRTATLLETCLKILDLREEGDVFTLHHRTDESTISDLHELSSETKIADLKTGEQRLVQLHICRKSKLSPGDVDPKAAAPKCKEEPTWTQSVCFLQAQVQELRTVLKIKEQSINELNRKVESLRACYEQ
ncbi:hypothetical protein NDU88_009368, partial [Pleurodeles waltl]